MENNSQINSSIEDGSYYYNARAWYSDIFHRPIAERSFYVIVILLSVINTYLSIDSFINIFPINPPVPFTVYSNNIWEDTASIKKLSSYAEEDKNVAVMRFMLSSYLENRESYDLPKYELRYLNIWGQSSPDVREEYKEEIDPSNSASPYAQYKNNAKIDVKIESIKFNRIKDNNFAATIVFRTSVISLYNNQELTHNKLAANIEYTYTDFVVDQKLDTSNFIAVLFGLTENQLKGSGEKRKIVPMTFKVTKYQAKEYLE